jgi:hypothetical protein
VLAGRPAGCGKPLERVTTAVNLHDPERVQPAQGTEAQSRDGDRLGNRIAVLELFDPVHNLPQASTTLFGERKPARHGAILRPTTGPWVLYAAR